MGVDPWAGVGVGEISVTDLPSSPGLLTTHINQPVHELP